MTLIPTFLNLNKESKTKHFCRILPNHIDSKVLVLQNLSFTVNYCGIIFLAATGINSQKEQKYTGARHQIIKFSDFKLKVSTKYSGRKAEVLLSDRILQSKIKPQTISCTRFAIVNTKTSR